MMVPMGSTVDTQRMEACQKRAEAYKKHNDAIKLSQEKNASSTTLVHFAFIY
jgi:uncharacterized membrane protein (DUF106 family)